MGHTMLRELIGMFYEVVWPPKYESGTNYSYYIISCGTTKTKERRLL